MPQVPVTKSINQSSVFAGTLSGGLYQRSTIPPDTKLIQVAGGKGDRKVGSKSQKLIISPAAQTNNDTLLDSEDAVDVSTENDLNTDTLLSDDSGTDVSSSDQDTLLSDDEATDVSANTASGEDTLLQDDGSTDAGTDEDALLSDDSDSDSTEQAAVGEDTLLSDDGDSDASEETDETDVSSGEDNLLSDDSESDATASADEGSNDLLDGDVVEADAPEADDEPESDAKDDNKETELSATEQHENLFIEDRYPSAGTCGTCHPKHYKEWSVSQHAYAQLSPIYLSLNNKINKLSNGSNGDFCLRCHSPVGANLGESSFASNLDRHPTSREGITCVVCHRVNKNYNKASGRLALIEGGLTEPVFGPKGNAGLKEALDQPDKFRVVTDPKESGRKIHKESKVFESIKTPVFCGTCHDVTLFNGFRLEEAFSEYRVSPAAAKGVTCQDCHMGKIQGKVSGYEQGPAAVVGDVPTATRKLTSHLFSGPDYSVVHPGIFPHNQEATAFKTMREWLQFKHEEGWGTEEFENAVSDDYKFPEAWVSVDDRFDAREILKKQFKLLDWAKEKRLEVLKIGFRLEDVITDRADEGGIKFRVKVANGTDGHNVPTGFTGERLVWLDIKVTDRDGKVVFRSGDRDPNGDVRDGHSEYVHAGEIELDPYLFSLQSIFVTQNGRGGEIEHVIPIPYPTFALPRVLPSTTSLVFSGEPATERNHKKGIEPNGHRWASYSVASDALTGKPPYKATIKLKAQAVPVNLLTNIQDVGFDFNMTPREVGDRLIEGTQVLWQKEVAFNTTVSALPSAVTFQVAPKKKSSARRATIEVDRK